MASPLLVAAVAAAAIWLVHKLMQKPSLPYPPGPPGKPILGNALDIPKSAMSQSHQYAEWKRIYGPLIHLNAMGTHLIIINDHDLAVELLDKRGAIYSDRPHMTMAGELIGWNRPLILRHYEDPLFKDIRRCLSQLFGPRQILETQAPVIEDETHLLIKRIIERPEHFEEYIHKCAAAIAMRIAYGYHPIAEGEDHVVKVATTAMSQADEVFTTPFLVDIMPWIKYVPEWFPGAGFKAKAKRYRAMVDELCELPYRMIMKRINEGTSEPCFVQSQFEEGNYTPEKEELTKWAATTLYGGGIDTTVSSVSAFFLAMTMFPHVFRKAQAEIDAVIGRDRLPTLADRPRLPYINAVLCEVLRWNPVGPLGIPHSTLEDDVYNGYLIPKGSVVIANLWHILNDPEVYKNPREFNPDRFLASPPEPDPLNTAFGFGRRSCPGKNLAEASTFLEIALSAAVLDISRAHDANGKEIVPEGEFKDGLLMHPLPYPNVIKARDARAEALVHAVTNQ